MEYIAFEYFHWVVAWGYISFQMMLGWLGCSISGLLPSFQTTGATYWQQAGQLAMRQVSSAYCNTFIDLWLWVKGYPKCWSGLRGSARVIITALKITTECIALIDLHIEWDCLGGPGSGGAGRPEAGVKRDASQIEHICEWHSPHPAYLNELVIHPN